MASEMVNGAVLYYEERGSGPPLLLVHGTGSYADIWSPVFDRLARSYRVIAYDRRGSPMLPPRCGRWINDPSLPTRAAIRSIACPVIVIEGDLSDPAFARAVGFVMRLLPQARLVSLPGAEHGLHIDQRQSWVEVVTQRIGHTPSPAAVQSLHPQQ